MSTRNNSYDWVHFSHNYLQLAHLGCQEILNKKYLKISFGSSFKLKYQAHDLFIAIIFNVKHGIEVFTKTLKVVLSNKLNKNDLTHNISELFELLKKEIEKHKIVNVIIKKHEINQSDTNLKIAYDNILKISDFLDELEKIIYKYHHCEILLKRLNNGFRNKFIIEDVSNTAFKYPENNLKINVHYDEVLEAITEDDILEILADIEILLKNFNDIGFVLDIYKQHEKN